MIKLNKQPELLPASTVAEAKQLSTSLLCDSLTGFGAMDYRIKPVSPDMKVAGTAYTVDLKTGSGTAVIAAVALAKAGYVLVISGKGNCANAVLGDLLVRTAIKSGLSGIVLDGVLRDVADLKEFSLPVFALGAIPGAAEKEGPGEINAVVACGGVAVNPGDLIVGDEDGVVVIPRAQAEAVIAAAKAKQANEAQRIQAIEDGLLLPEWLKKQIIEVDE